MGAGGAFVNLLNSLHIEIIIHFSNRYIPLEDDEKTIDIDGVTITINHTQTYPALHLQCS